MFKIKIDQVSSYYKENNFFSFLSLGQQWNSLQGENDNTPQETQRIILSKTGLWNNEIL